MEDQIYQRIFNAFNASHRGSSKSATQDLELFTGTPEAALHTLDTVRSIGTQQQFHIHKTSYLRGLMRSLSRSGWNQTHAPKLIETADWLVSLNESVPHSTNYMRQVRILLATIQQKVSVPQEKVQEWSKAVACKTPRNYVPKFKITYPPECYELPFSGRSHVQNFNTDDRN